MADSGKQVLVIASLGGVLLTTIGIVALAKLDTDLPRLVGIVGGVVIAGVAVASGGAVFIGRRGQDGSQTTARIGPGQVESPKAASETVSPSRRRVKKGPARQMSAAKADEEDEVRTVA